MAAARGTNLRLNSAAAPASGSVAVEGRSGAMRRCCHVMLVGLALLAASAGTALAQAGGAKPATRPAAGDARAVGAEAIALFERVCVAALARRQPAETVAAAELAASSRVPADQLRVRGTVRETAAWRVQGRFGRHSVVMLEPGNQCGLYTEGVDSDAFLDAMQALMLRAEAMPGWMRRGEPSRSASQRPYGMLTYLRADYTSILPMENKPPQSGPVPLPAVTILASAASRTDGRPNTAVITTSFEPPR